MNGLLNLLQLNCRYKYFDEEYNDSAYTVLPITRNFILNTIMKPEEESNIRKRLTDWYQGKDIKNPTERAIVQKIRQGSEKPEKSLLTLANMSLRDGDYKSAEEYFIKAIQRNSKSYEALPFYQNAHTCLAIEIDFH